MSNSDFDPSVFARIGYILHKQDTEDSQKKLVELEKTKDRLRNSIDNITKNELGIELLCKLIDIIENNDNDIETETETE